MHTACVDLGGEILQKMKDVLAKIILVVCIWSENFFRTLTTPLLKSYLLCTYGRRHSIVKEGRLT